jgi:hypothetical protein
LPPGAPKFHGFVVILLVGGALSLPGYLAVGNGFGVFAVNVRFVLECRRWISSEHPMLAKSNSCCRVAAKLLLDVPHTKRTRSRTHEEFKEAILIATLMGTRSPLSESIATHPTETAHLLPSTRPIGYSWSYFACDENA